MTYPPGPPTHPPTPYGPIPPQSDSRRALTLVLCAIVVVLALILAAGIVFVAKARDGDIYVPGLTLTAANDPGIDPFTDPVLVAGSGDLPENVALTGTAGAADLGGRAVNGTDAGLYGSGDAAACDTAALSNRLLADPPAARAWASVYGISTADIPHYLNTLTPVVLTTDTWVTNHSYTSGRAVPFQSVLQRGTAVYVDSAGVPRAMCSCGNPLAPPTAAPLGGYRLEGRPWEGYKSRSVARIAYSNQHVTAVGKSTTIVPAPPAPQPGTPAGDVLELLNFLTGQLFSQPAGGLLDLSGFPPPSGPLPTPAALNTPFEAGTDEDAERNGLLAPGDPAAAPALEKRAEEHDGLPEGAPSTDSPAPDSSGPDSAGPDTPSPGSDAPAPDASVPASDVPVPEEPGYEAPGSEVPGPASEPGAPGVPGPENPAEAPATPTSFSGSGEVVGSFSFDDAGLSVGCTVPHTPELGTVSLSCTDGVARSVAGAALQRSSVSGSTTGTGVWTLTLTAVGASQTVTVRSANWIVVPPAAPASEPPAPDVSTDAAPPTEEAAVDTTTTTTTTENPPAPEAPAEPEAPAQTP
ncbi:DUF6777 domain-containing protein [Gordonia sp. KTR9]|uniref:DUF6777 domain-containing protein n=1 Tax=Gordonia sp. KTR9 TaxID=337191 RepID=UPI00027DDDFB|nr:DUF6777 domain-containing protein [Gordonia sp. KTR9]AFR46734.1 hypothetical protein KTR9_0066 [Gordonia sp. KTR9]